MFCPIRKREEEEWRSRRRRRRRRKEDEWRRRRRRRRKRRRRRRRRRRGRCFVNEMDKELERETAKHETRKKRAPNFEPQMRRFSSRSLD